MNILSQPFTWGLVVGLFLMVMTWRLMRKDVMMLRSDNKRLLEENRELQSHLSTQLKINAKGNGELEKQLEALKEQNENLRIASLSCSQNRAAGCAAAYPRSGYFHKTRIRQPNLQ